jgi:hypothetical protein
MTDTICARAAQYDLEHEGDDADVLFYLEFVRRYQPRRGLQLGRAADAWPLGLPAAAAPAVGFDIVDFDQ